MSYEHASSPLTTKYGYGTFHCFTFGPHEEDNILCIEVPSSSDAPYVRVQSACYTAEIFRSTDCDCHEQLDTSLRIVHQHGGLFVYVLCDGRGAGLLIKARALRMYADEGIDTHDAYARMGVEVDPRNYERVSQVVRSFDLDCVRLLTNNPRKLSGLQEAGITVVHEPLRVLPTDSSRAYLETKRDKFGHLLD